MLRKVVVAYYKFQHLCQYTSETFRQMVIPIYSEVYLLFEKVSVDFKLLFKHDFSSVLNNERVRLQVSCCSQDFPVFLHPSYTAQL